MTIRAALCGIYTAIRAWLWPSDSPQPAPPGAQAPIDQPPADLPAADPPETIDTAEPMFAYHYGMLAGALWAWNRHWTDLHRFGRWRKEHRENPPVDSLEQMADCLCNCRAIDAPRDPSTFWAEFALGLPSADNQEALQFFIDGVFWGAKLTFRRIAELQHKAKQAEQQRAKPFKGMARDGDVG